LEGDRKRRRIAGWCAIGVAASYVVAGAAYFLQPGAQRSDDPALFWASVLVDPRMLLTSYWALAAVGIFGLGAVAGISSLVRAGNEGLMGWMQNLAILGFAVGAVSNIRLASVTQERALFYFCESCTANDNYKKIINGTDSLVSLDPTGWLTFGLVGLWILCVSILALRTGGLPRPAAWLGIGAAVLSFLFPVSSSAGFPDANTFLIPVGVIAALLWYGWVARILLR
jgi:hypothetical protein